MDVDMINMMIQMETFPDDHDQVVLQNLYSEFSSGGPTMFHHLNVEPNVLSNPTPPASSSFITNPMIDPTSATTTAATATSLSLSRNISSFDLRNNSMAAMREMIFRIAAMQPIHIDPESVKPPKRRNVKISKDPQSVAARHRRERISERIRILQRLVPGGTNMDTASMLDEAIHYVKFLKKQVQTLEQVGVINTRPGLGFSGTGMNCSNNVNYSSALLKANYNQQSQLVGSLQMRR